MRLRNHTKTSTDLIREIIAFVRPSGIANFDMEVKNSRRGYCGLAYTQGTSYHWRTVPKKGGGRKIVRPQLITLGLCVRRSRGKWMKPYGWTARKGYLGVTVFSHEEAVVHLIAHELRHLWQAKVKTGRRVWGARGQFSERDADAYAVHKLREWRRRKEK